jgi:hypothetical protein
MSRALQRPNTVATQRLRRDEYYQSSRENTSMPIPDERFPQVEEYDEDAVENTERAEMLDENDELEFESADADTADDVILDQDEAGETDTAGFGYGDPSD